MKQTCGELIPNLETPSFGFEKKLIIAKNTGIFKKDGRKKPKNDDGSIASKILDYLNENFEFIKDIVVLVFIEEEADSTDLYKFIDSNGIVCNFEFQKPNQIASRIKTIANAYNVNIDAATLAYLIESCGTNMQELINEIRKLIEYARRAVKL